MIKFQKFYVQRGELKAKVFYSLDNRVDGRKCVTLYAKGYDRALAEIFAEAPGAEYKNDSDIMADYFDQGRVVLFEASPNYAAARARAEAEAALVAAKSKAYYERRGMAVVGL